MKITVWFAVAGAALGIQGVASAADIAKARPAPAYNPCSNARFSGAYLGGNAGAIAYAATRSDRDQYFVSTYEYSLSAIGPTVGVQAGYDWQSCNKVLGIVADWNWTDAEAHRQIVPNLISGDIHSKMDWFSTIRARAGLAVNDTLFYVTGGVAAAHVSSAVSTSQQHFAFNSVRWGLVGGAGAEFSLGNNWSLNAKSLYMRFAKDTNTLISPVRGALSFENNNSAWVNRVGLNYRFGNPQNAYASASSRVATSPDPCGPSRFGGGYVGGNLGMVSATARRGDHDLYFLAGNGTEQSASANSFTAGAQAGWDWRSCNTLLGVVADWNWANADTQMPVRFRSSSFGDMNTGMDWFATVRGRAGLVVDNTLVYVTGGVAAARIGTIGLARFNDPDIEESFAFGKTRLGLVGGVGAEFALAGNWSMNTELLYMQFSKSTDTFNSVNSPQPGITSFESHDSAWVSRAGLNYRWGNPGVAKASATTSCGPARFAGGYVGGNVGAIHHTAVNRDQDALHQFSRGVHLNYRCRNRRRSNGLRLAILREGFRRRCRLELDQRELDRANVSQRYRHISPGHVHPKRSELVRHGSRPRRSRGE